jgi:hypothetical protein
VCVATGALRKLRFSTNHSGRKRASGSWLRARPARAGSDSYCSSASGSHILVTRCVWWLPDPEFTLSLPLARAAAAVKLGTLKLQTNTHM